MKEITYEQYKAYLNGWEDPDKQGQGKYVIKVPKGKRLVLSGGRYFLADKLGEAIVKTKKK